MRRRWWKRQLLSCVFTACGVGLVLLPVLVLLLRRRAAASPLDMEVLTGAPRVAASASPPAASLSAQAAAPKALQYDQLVWDATSCARRGAR